MAQQEIKKLPNGWINTTIGDYLEIHNGKRKPISLKEREKCQGDFPYYGATGIIDYLDGYTHEGQYILIGEDGANLLSKSKPLAFLADGKYWVNNHAHTLKCSLDCPNNYIEQYVNSLTLGSWVTGSAQPKLNKANLEKIPVPLAPLPEQKRIVEKLDSLLAQVDTIQQRLNNLPDIIKRFRQSVLAAAVSGKLTEQWRGENSTISIDELLKNIQKEREELKKAKKLKPSFGKFDDVAPIFENCPNSWAWCCFDQISKNNNNALKAGPFGSALKKSDCTDSGYRVYGQEQVIAGDERLVSYYVGDEKFEQLSACSVASGDILISLVGTIGKVLILSDEVEKGIINPRLVKLSLNEKVNRDFIKYYLDSIYAKEFFGQFSHGGTMDILNLGILKKLPIALPSIEEQTEIVRLVEQYFALADTLEKNLANAKQRVDNLTQSILAKAFKGELVPQDPNDEPADKLLERIKAARLEAEKLEKAAKKAAKAKKK